MLLSPCDHLIRGQARFDVCLVVQNRLLRGHSPCAKRHLAIADTRSLTQVRLREQGAPFGTRSASLQKCRLTIGEEGVLLKVMCKEQGELVIDGHPEPFITRFSNDVAENAHQLQPMRLKH